MFVWDRTKSSWEGKVKEHTDNPWERAPVKARWGFVLYLLVRVSTMLLATLADSTISKAERRCKLRSAEYCVTEKWVG